MVQRETFDQVISYNADQWLIFICHGSINHKVNCDECYIPFYWHYPPLYFDLPFRIEKPSQEIRLAKRKELFDRLTSLKDNITNRFDDPNDQVETTIEMVQKYSKMMADIKDHPDEIIWDMLNAQAFVTSIQTTTGYGDIVPLTPGGKIFTIAYALVGVPIFLWYIVKLGGVFRVFTMNIFSIVKACLWLLILRLTVSAVFINFDLLFSTAQLILLLNLKT